MNDEEKEKAPTSPALSSVQLKALYYDVQAERQQCDIKLERINAAIAEAIQREAKENNGSRSTT